MIQTTPPETVATTTADEVTDPSVSVETTATEPTETTETAPEGVVPDVSGQLAGEARLALREAGYKVYLNTGAFEVQPGAKPEVVCAQSPQAGTASEAGSQVRLVIRESCEAYGE